MKFKLLTKNYLSYMILFTIATAMAITLTSCSNDADDNVRTIDIVVAPDTNNENNYQEEIDDNTQTPTTAYINIQIADAESAPNFDLYYSIDFRDAYTTYWNSDLDWLSFNQPLAIWADETLADFQLIGVYLDYRDDGALLATATHSYYTIPLLDTPLVIEWFFTAGLFPNNGISFVDSNGTRRFFAIQAAYGHEDSIHRLLEFEDGGVLFPPWEE
ncbi:MAG: hypothetical protein FWC92_04325 [Defluviitaleaceae bacterium]|nr:hypothetical protein [Defluviitaleaceae bacterium]